MITGLTKLIILSSSNYLDLWYIRMKDIDRMNICRTTMEREKKTYNYIFYSEICFKFPK
ncbi:hypothetical protein [Listeria monocytogenes]|uniref:hypothetical protein n=1 Tax=Listeria monocytogenes TaxID=1639 RepID=UPI000321018B|nr:hypothetical protein [Listeria monocytogenes]MCG3304168.1 hypothetical protein [Listeria monocytogenes]